MPGRTAAPAAAASTRPWQSCGAHAQEVAALAKQLEEGVVQSSYEQVMQAVSDFEKGNLRLSTVLTALEHERKG